MFSGTVTWFDPERGVRGIAVDGAGHDVLVRWDRVRLTMHNGPVGALAARVWTP